MIYKIRVTKMLDEWVSFFCEKAHMRKSVFIRRLFNKGCNAFMFDFVKKCDELRMESKPDD